MIETLPQHYQGVGVQQKDNGSHSLVHKKATINFWIPILINEDSTKILTLHAKVAVFGQYQPL